MEMPFSNPMQNARNIAAKNLGMLENSLADSPAEDERWLDNWHSPQNTNTTRMVLPNQKPVRYKTIRDTEQEAPMTSEPPAPAASGSETNTNKDSSEQPFTLREFEIW